MKSILLKDLELFWRQSLKKEGINLTEDNISEEDCQKAKKVLCNMIDMILADESA